MELTRICSTTTPSTPIEWNNLIELEDFILYKGTTFKAVFTFEEIDGTPIPIDDNNIVFHIVESDGTVVLLFSIANPTVNGSVVNIIDDPNGKVEVLITDEETTTLDEGTLYWWVTLDTSGGDSFLRGKGKITVKNPY